MQVIHDSFSLKYREPFGAVCTGATVRLSLVTSEKCAAKLLYWFSDSPHETDMTQASCDGGFMHSVTLTVPPSPCLVWYMFELCTDGGILYFCGSHGEGYLSDKPESSYQITVYIPHELPAWYRKAVAYQIFPDRFARGRTYGGLMRISSHTNIGQSVYIHDSWDDDVIADALPFEEYYNPCDFFCGDLKGIEENLPYLTSLGVTCIYLNPIFSSPSNHRYDTSDYMTVDGILGGDEAFFSLKAACEDCGIHIILDGVFSHTGADSVYFNRYGRFPGCGAYQSRKSPYYTWYDFIDYPDSYRSWWGFPSLPETDEDNPSFRSYVAGCIAKWRVSWRLDVADELTDDFMRFLYCEVKKTDEEAVVIGEVWEDASDKHSKGHRRPYTDGDCVDGVMNYPLRQLIIDFLNDIITAGEFCRNVRILQENYPLQFLTGCLNITGSHDTERLITALSYNENDKITQQTGLFSEKELTRTEKKVILFMSVLFMSDGIPCIYYGDEQGMAGGCDPYCRRPFVRRGGEVQRICSLLGKLRADLSVFDTRAKQYACGDDVVIIVREARGESVICAVNRAETERQILLSAKAGRIYEDLYTGNVYEARDGTLDITLAGSDAAVLVCKNSGGTECLTDDTEQTGSVL